MANALAIDLHAAAQETTAGNGTSVDIGVTRSAVKLALIVTGLTGGKAVVKVETSADDSSWRLIGVLEVNAAGKQKRAFDDCDRYVRASWTVGTDITFSLAGNAHQLFCERDDLLASIPEKTLARAAKEIVARAMIRASSDMVDTLGFPFPLPLTAWSESIVGRCADLTAFEILKQGGFQGAGIDELVTKSYDDARKWMRDVRKGDEKPQGVSPPDNRGIKTSSGNPDDPTNYKKRLSDDWGVF